MSPAPALTLRRSPARPGTAATLRLAVYGPISLLTAAVAHGAGGGALTPTWSGLAPQALAFLAATGLLLLAQVTGRCRGWASLAAVTSAAQVGVHVLLGHGACHCAGHAGAPATAHPAGVAAGHPPAHGAVQGHPALEGTAGWAGHAHGAPPGHAGLGAHGHADHVAGTHAVDPRMIVWHVLAALVTALLLQFGERLARAAVEVLRGVLSGLRPACAPALQARARVCAREHARVVRTLVVPGGVGRRGPPARPALLAGRGALAPS